MAKFKKYSKVKFKLRKELVGIIAVILIMIGTTFVLNLPSEKDKIYKEYAGSLSSSEHLFEYVSKDQLVKLIESGDQIFVYFGSPDCANCVAEINTINSQAAYWDVETIYYLNSSFTDEKDREEDSEFNSMLLDWETKFKDVSLDFTPSIWVYEDKELKFNSQDYIGDDDTTMTKSWAAIASEAFSLNLPEKVKDAA